MPRKASILQDGATTSPKKEEKKAKEQPPIEEKEKSIGLLDKLIAINRCMGHKVDIKTSTGVSLTGKIINIAYDYIYIMVGNGDIKKCKLSIVKTCVSVP
jgi:hypothetical protein